MLVNSQQQSRSFHSLNLESLRGTFSPGLLGGGNKNSQPVADPLPFEQPPQHEISPTSFPSEEAREIPLGSAPIPHKKAGYKAQLQGSDWSGLRLNACKFVSADLRGSCFDYASLGQAKFVNANLLTTSFNGWQQYLSVNSLLETRKEVKCTHYKTGIRLVTYSPDGQWIGVAARGAPTLIDPRTSEVFGLGQHESIVLSLSFSSDSQILLSASWDTTIKGWSVQTKRGIFTIQTDRGVNSAYFLHGTENVVYSLIDGRVECRNVTTQQKHVMCVSGAILGISDSGRRLASGSSRVELWALPEMTPLVFLDSCQSLVKSFQFTPDDRYLLILYEHISRLCVLDIEQKAVVCQTRCAGLLQMIREPGSEHIVLRYTNRIELTSVEELAKGRRPAVEETGVFGLKESGTFIRAYLSDNGIYTFDFETGITKKVADSDRALLMFSPGCFYLLVLETVRMTLTVISMTTFDQVTSLKVDLVHCCFLSESSFCTLSKDLEVKVFTIDENIATIKVQTPRPLQTLIKLKSSQGNESPPDSLIKAMGDIALSLDHRWIAWADYHCQVHLQHVEYGYLTSFQCLSSPTIAFNLHNTCLLLCDVLTVRKIPLDSFLEFVD